MPRIVVGAVMLASLLAGCTHLLPPPPEPLAYDPAAAAATCKVFHPVRAADGRLLTKGLGGEFPHHRGLFLGWNDTQWRGRHLDFWHCHGGESQRFAGFVAPATVGLTDDWQVSSLTWCAPDGSEVLRERRALRLADEGAGTLHYALRSHLEALDQPLHLGGDPQHAGQQFRALQQFAEPGATPLRYVRPAGAEPHDNDVWTNCAWTAAILPFADRPVTVLRVEGRANPTPTWSTRGYGRFGAMWTIDLPAHGAVDLTVDYVVADGERDAAWCASQAARLRGA